MLYAEIKIPIINLFSTQVILKENVGRPIIFRFNGIFPFLWNKKTSGKAESFKTEERSIRYVQKTPTTSLPKIKSTPQYR